MVDVMSFNTYVAKEIGVDGAIMLNNLYYWIEHNKANKTHYHDGHYWTYNSMEAYTKIYEFWSVGQIRRILNNLKNEGYIITGNYNKAGYDRTIWYALTEKAISLICRNQQMDLQKSTNGFAEIDEPIPYSTTDSNAHKNYSSETEEVEKEDINKVMSAWNNLNLTQLRNIKGNREKTLHARIKEYSIDDVLKAISNISNSEFLKGHNNNGWKITFDWMLKPNNFVKVLEGNYTDKTEKVDKPQRVINTELDFNYKSDAEFDQF